MIDKSLMSSWYLLVLINSPLFPLVPLLRLQPGPERLRPGLPLVRSSTASPSRIIRYPLENHHFSIFFMGKFTINGDVP